MRKIWLIFILIFFCGFNFPQRIISLSPSVTSSLFLLGLKDKIVGVTVFCKYPLEAKYIEKIGTCLEPNIEKIVSLKPDIVIASEINRPATLNRLKKLGLRTVLSSQGNNFYDMCRNFVELGKITGREKKAKKIINEVNLKTDIIKKKFRNKTKKSIFVELGANPLVTAGNNTFIDEMIEFAGGINIAKEAGNGYFRYSKEEVIRKKPDIILMVYMEGSTTEEEIKIWKIKFAMNKIYVINDYKICSPTPETFVDGLTEITDILHHDEK